MNFDWEAWIERHPVGAVLLLIGFVVLLCLGPDDTTESEHRAQAQEQSR